MNEEIAVASSELAALLESRAATYGLLSRLYRVEVDEACLNDLCALRVPAHTGNADVDAGYRKIIEFLSGRWENTLTELAVDYARTFISHGMDSTSVAYPFESVYVSEKRLLMQEARDQVRYIYLSEGLNKTAQWREGEDHIALELEFMQLMSLRTKEALESGDEDAAAHALLVSRNFMADHLTPWVHLFTDDMKKFAKTGLYQGLAQLTEGFLAEDAELLAEMLDEQEEQ